jgi:hypothetical protein
MKESDQGSPLEAVGQDCSASHPNGTGEALVASRFPSFQMSP